MVERRTIWGDFPAPDEEEVAEAWQLISQRITLTAEMTGQPMLTSANRERFREFGEASPAFISNFIAIGEDVGTQNGNRELTVAYLSGVADALELLGTIALNRTFKGLMPPDLEEEHPYLHTDQLAVEVTGDIDSPAGIKPEFQEVMQRSHSAMRELLAPLSPVVTVPELAELANAGVNFRALAEAHAAMTQLGMRPELVLAPTLGPAEWEYVYRHLQTSPRNNQAGHLKNGGLRITEEIRNHWDKLMRQTVATDAHALKTKKLIWQVALMPSAETPRVINASHYGAVDEDGHINPELHADLSMLNDYRPPHVDPAHLHPTIPAYLSFQAMRLHTGKLPADNDMWVWLHGQYTENDRLLAPRGQCSLLDGQVEVSGDYPTYYADNTGIRLPIWG